MEQEVDEQGQELLRQYHPATKKTLQKVFIIRVVVGAIIGQYGSVSAKKTARA
ncbi:MULTISPECIES: hypothetical protein [unclassified Microcoleus]|uniref:hypothetical protein n=1 Tax=unclassified Microcoleus TaxID=2642155 RepID=UPI002FD4734E